MDICTTLPLNSWADEPPQAGRQWSPGKHRASLSCREMLQQTLMVFLVNSQHNESSVPPSEFLLSTPTVVILKWSRISFSPLYVCTLFLSFLPSVLHSFNPTARWLSSFHLYAFPSLFLSISFFLPTLFLYLSCNYSFQLLTCVIADKCICATKAKMRENN